MKRLLACLMIASSVFAFATVTASAETEFNSVIESTVTRINNERGVSSDNSFVMHLSNTDYMTAEGWDNTDYKWFNAEGNSEYLEVDLNSNNLCNFPLDKNLDEYNFEQMVFVDGVPLSEYKIEHPYTLTGNMRTRVNTLSINFADPVFASVSAVEILEGCQFPTLARSCMDSRSTSCIQITKSVKYEKKNGVWVLYFEGYQEGFEYDGDEKMFALSPETNYKNHTAVPLTSYADIFQKEETLAGGVYKGLALASGSDTRKGYITVLRLVNPIDSEEFETINLRLYTNHKRTIYSYNDNNITEDSLGNVLESFALDGAVHTTVSLMSSLYADPDGMVRTIIFKFNEDGEPFINSDGEEVYDENGNLSRDQLFFISFNLERERSSELLTKDSFIVVDNGESYDVIFRFNKNCEETGVELDTTKVILNGQSLRKILAECKSATAEWATMGTVCQVVLTLPKSYTGVSQIKNAESSFWGNSMGVTKGLVFPDGTVLDKNYTCHVYVTEKILDSEVDVDYAKTTVLGITHEFVTGSNNIHFKIKFDKKITTANYYHACEIERWREKDLVASNPLYYDAGISKVFVKNGFKSSLLDNIVINGKSIGDWHADNANALTNIQTHYGQSGFEYVDVHFEAFSPSTYNQIVDLVKAGNGVTIEIKEGLKFMTNCSVQKTQTFELIGGTFIEKFANSGIHVYYDGSEVQNGASVNVKTVVAPSSVVVEGVLNYEVTHQTNGTVTEFTVTYDGGEFKFTVNTDAVESESQTQSGSSGGGGCKSSVEMPIIGSFLVLIALAFALKERK